MQTPEDIVDPLLPIVDPHHHLWDRRGHRYLLDELLADTGSGHNVVATVFVECGAFYRADGPAEAMKPVGEIEFVNGVAAQSASGLYGPTSAPAPASSATPTCMLGDGVGPVLEAHDRGRQRPLSRHPPRRRLGRRPGGARPAHTSRRGGCYRDARLPRGLRASGAARA